VQTLEKTRKWRWGVNRWIVLLFIVLGIFAANAYPPIRPHIQVAPEKISGVLFTLPYIGPFYLTNTLVASFITYILLIIIAFFVKRAATSGDLVPKGFSGAVEALIEIIYNQTETTAGKWAKTIFPFFATITLVVLLSNWLEMLPGVDSIGFIEHAAKGYNVQEIIPGVISGLVQGTGNAVIVPYVRVASTDLNFTLALALISVFMTQVIGVRAQGLDYFSKFFNVKTLFTKPLFGAIDFAVGILELISEMSKLLSFTFRLFGNIFAGSVLLFLIGSMIPVFAQSAVLLFEFFIGAIQAVVFGMLTMIFMTMATQGHGDHEEGHSEA
jgi:F-type H+-transporting ATPase subunit a